MSDDEINMVVGAGNTDDVHDIVSNVAKSVEEALKEVSNIIKI